MEDEKKFEHESFGYISATHVSGGMPLFDSAIDHLNYVEISIGNAIQYLDHGRSRIHPSKEIIRIAMTEHQFASFISNPNRRDTACTLRRVNGKSVEPPPADKNTKETFEEDIRAKAKAMQDELVAAMTALDELLAKGKAGKGELTMVRERIATAQRELTANMPFLMKCFAENMENLTARAKMDIDAHMRMVGQLLSRETLPQIEEDSD